MSYNLTVINEITTQEVQEAVNTSGMMVLMESICLYSAAKDIKLSIHSNKLNLVFVAPLIQHSELLQDIHTLDKQLHKLHPNLKTLNITVTTDVSYKQYAECDVLIRFNATAKNTCKFIKHRYLERNDTIGKALKLFDYKRKSPVKPMISDLQILRDTLPIIEESEQLFHLLDTCRPHLDNFRNYAIVQTDYHKTPEVYHEIKRYMSLNKIENPIGLLVTADISVSSINDCRAFIDYERGMYRLRKLVKRPKEVDRRQTVEEDTKPASEIRSLQRKAAWKVIEPTISRINTMIVNTLRDSSRTSVKVRLTCGDADYADFISGHYAEKGFSVQRLARTSVDTLIVVSWGKPNIVQRIIEEKDELDEVFGC